ncbi:MAG: hypothetical protein AAF845_05760 [Bacteroidota bacterium]
MIGADAEVVARLTLEEGEAVRSANRVSREVRQIGTDADTAGGPLNRLGGYIRGLVAAAAIAALTTYSRRLFDLGTTAEEVSSKFSAVMGPAAAKLDDDLRELANRAGLTQTEIRGLAATTGAIAQGLGQTQEQSAATALEVQRLAGDITSFSNVTGGAVEVTEAINSAIVGERERLKSLGIVLRETDVQQRQAQLAAEGHEGALTDQGKVTATLQLITEKAGVAIGDLERTQDSTANTARRLSAEVREQEERFARLNTVTFNFVLGALADLIRENEVAGRSFAERLARGVLIAVGAMVRGVQRAIAFGRALASLGDAAGDLVSPSGSFSFLAVGVNSVLGLMASLEKRVLQTTVGVRRMQRAWADFRDDPKRVDELTAEIEDLEKAIDDANAAIDRAGRQFGGTFFMPSGSLGGSLGGALADFDALAAGIDQSDLAGGVPGLGDSTIGTGGGTGTAAGGGAATASGTRSRATGEAMSRFQLEREEARAFADEIQTILSDVEGQAVEVTQTAAGRIVGLMQNHHAAISGILSGVGQIFRLVGDESKAAFVAYKLVAIAEATVAGVLAVQKSLPNVPLAIAMGVTAAANIATILATNPSGSPSGTADTGAGSVSAAGSPARGASSVRAGLALGFEAPDGAAVDPGDRGASFSQRTEVSVQIEGREVGRAVDEYNRRRDGRRGGGESL